MTENKENSTDPKEPEVLLSFAPDEPFIVKTGESLQYYETYANLEGAFDAHKVRSDKIWTVRELTKDTDPSSGHLTIHRIRWLGFDHSTEVETYIDATGYKVINDEQGTTTLRSAFFNSLNTERFTGYSEGDEVMPPDEWPYFYYNQPK